MTNVVVNIAGRPYTMQCPDGEEAHLQDLAALLDSEVSRIRQNVGAIGDIRQLVMAGLMVADRLSEATRRMEALESEVQLLSDSKTAALAEIKMLEDKFARALEVAAEKMEEMVK